MTFHGREWLPIPEAAKYLSEKLEETWKQEHVYAAVLEGRLHLVARLMSGTRSVYEERVEGLVNVPIKGAAQYHLERLEHGLRERYEVVDSWKGANIIVERDGKEHQLDYTEFPNGTQLGVRVEALEACIQQTSPKAADALDEPLGERERETLLVIIAALAKKAGIDMSHPTTAAKKIVREVELLGAKIHWQTVDNKLKQVKEVVEKLKT